MKLHAPSLFYCTPSRRDIVCLLRLIVDSLPSRIRNSYLLFRLAKTSFNLPASLYSFRSSAYSSEQLIYLYAPSSPAFIEPISPLTDVNSFHFRALLRLSHEVSPHSILDAACGSGVLLRALAMQHPQAELTALDLAKPARLPANCTFIQSSLEPAFDFPQKYDLVICTHALEHLASPLHVFDQLLEVASSTLVLICPLERRHRWGLNYHTTFFPSQDDFIDYFKLKQRDVGFTVYSRLGDIMCIIKKPSSN